jgi:protein tyrosine/serine phosphatase
VAATTRLGIRHIDFKMSASKQLPLEKVEMLIALMREAPKPLLVHCQGGADRTGLASLLYTSLIAGVNEDLAEWQLSPLFGHFGIPYLTGSYQMDETWKKFEIATRIDSEESVARRRFETSQK